MTMTPSEINRLVFGKDPTENVVGLEVHDSYAELFIESPTGIQTKVIPNKHWLVARERLDEDFMRLHGDLFYRYVKVYDDVTEYYIDKRKYTKKETFSVGDLKEATMLSRGITYFKGMKVQDVYVLGFDIESTSLLDNPNKKILLISNTFRKNGQVIRKLFAYDQYPDEASLINAWCEWVREVNPSVIVGHNIFMYDFPYLQQCAENAGLSGLALGRDGSALKFNRWTSKFRFDGSQDYDYTRCNIYGREIVDTMFLSMKYDTVKRQ
jgi:DNA polymerase I